MNRRHRHAGEKEGKLERTQEINPAPGGEREPLSATHKTIFSSLSLIVRLLLFDLSYFDSSSCILSFLLCKNTAKEEVAGG